MPESVRIVKVSHTEQKKGECRKAPEHGSEGALSAFPRAKCDAESGFGRRFAVRFGLVRHIELLDPAIEAGARDAQQLGGARLVSAGLAQGTLDRVPLDLGEDLVEGLQGAGSRREIGAAQVAANRGWQVLDGDPGLISAAKFVGVIDNARQLGQVSGPVVFEQSPKRLGRKPGALGAAALIGALEEVLCQDGQLVAPLAERSQANHERGQRVVEVSPDTLV